MNLYRQTLAPTLRRSPSPSFDDFDDSNDNIQLDPELARIKAEALSRLTSTKDQDTFSGPPEVTIIVKWIPHPKNKDAKAQQWTHTIKRVSELL